MKPLILTARLEAKAQTYFDDLRTQHFPPERNYLAAHVTMFHALPGSELPLISTQLGEMGKNHARLEGTVTGLRSLGNGVAFMIECAELLEIRRELAKRWRAVLTPQDGQGWRPHLTVQNKVSRERARALVEQLTGGFTPLPVRFEGLDLWHYEGGPWSVAGRYSFRSE